MRAAVYLRVSTEEQAQEGTSIGTQLERCEGYITAQGWTLVTVESDEGISGTRESRPGLDRLMAQCRSGLIDVLVVAKIDRLSRSSRHFENTVGELDDLDVNIVSVAESIDSTTSSGRALRSLLAVFAAFEREQIVERTSAGLRATAKAGYFTGGPAPSGFRSEPDGAHKRLVVAEPEAAWLRVAVDMILDEGRSTKATADALNALGYTPRKTGRFSHHNLRHILTNAPLSGTWWYGRTGKNAGIQEPVPVQIPEIITPERHALLLAALDATSTTRVHKSTYLLSRGRLIAVCGAHHHGTTRKDRGLRQYRCNSSYPDAEPRCSCPRVNADLIEGRAWSEVNAILSEPNRLERMATDYLGLDEARGEIDEDQLHVLDRKIANLQQTLNSRVFEYLSGGVNADAVRDATAVMEGDLEELRTMRGSLAAWQADHQSQTDRVGQLVEMASRASPRLSSLTEAEKRLIIDLLDLRVTITKWTTCTNCLGKGKVAGGAGGKTCPVCFGSRQVPSTRVEGRIFDGLFDALDSPSNGGHRHTGPSLPFTVVAS